MRSPRAPLLAALAGVGLWLGAPALADSVVNQGYVYDDYAETWLYSYTFSTSGALEPGMQWGLYGLRGVVDATVGSAGEDWSVSYTSTYVVYTYVGPSRDDGTFGLFDVEATVGPGTVTWESDGTTGDPPYSGTTIGPTPEPGTLALTLLGMGLVAAFRRRRKGRR